MRLGPIESKYYPELHAIHIKAERLFCTDFEAFTVNMNARKGFMVFTDDDKMIGCISMSNYVPGLDIMCHITVDPDYHGKWYNMDLHKQVSDYVFNELDVVRASAYYFEGINDRTGRFLEKIGFTHEGCIRNGVKDGDKFCNVHMYGLLKEERRK